MTAFRTLSLGTEEDPMLKRLYFGLLFMTAIGTLAAQAQTDGSAGVGPSAHQKPTGPVNEKFLTPTGETVAHPGEPQGAPATALDRGIEQPNNRIDQSICSNCK
jgi:hypothetical protein